MANLMTNEQYTYEKLSAKYGAFRVPTYKIRIDKKELTAESKLLIKEITIDLTCQNEAGGCIFEVMGAFNPTERSFDKAAMNTYFQLGKMVEVDIGYIKTVNVFKGYISAVTVSLGPEMPIIRVECTDVKGIMMNNHITEQRTETKLNDVVSNILKNQCYKYYYDDLHIDMIETPQRKIEIAGESDFDFLVRLANRINYEFFVCQGTVYFRKPMPLKRPLMELEYGYNLLNFEHRVSLEGQVLELEVRSSDIEKGKVISAVAKSNVQMSSGPSAKKALSKLKKAIVDSSVESEQEARARAEALLKKLNENFTTANIECVGIPEIVPGRFIKIKKLGEGLEGNYYILRVRHTIDQSSFSTSIEARADI